MKSLIVKIMYVIEKEKGENKFKKLMQQNICKNTTQIEKIVIK